MAYGHTGNPQEHRTLVEAHFRIIGYSGVTFSTCYGILVIQKNKAAMNKKELSAREQNKLAPAEQLQYVLEHVPGAIEVDNGHIWTVTVDGLSQYEYGCSISYTEAGKYLHRYIKNYDRFSTALSGFMRKALSYKSSVDLENLHIIKRMAKAEEVCKVLGVGASIPKNQKYPDMCLEIIKGEDTKVILKGKYYAPQGMYLETKFNCYWNVPSLAALKAVLDFDAKNGESRMQFENHLTECYKLSDDEK